MDYLLLRKLNKLYFSYKDIGKILNLTNESAKVVANRYVNKGYIIRLKRGFYILREKWDRLATEEKFILANTLQVPSYISLTTALAYWEYTTQVQQDYYESVNIFRTTEFVIEPVVFRYTRLNKKLYFGYIKKDNFFIATPEKAVLDILYLMTIKKYKFDLSSVDWKKFDKKNIKKYFVKYPQKTQTGISKLWKF